MNKTRFAALTAGLLARKGEAEPVASPFADQLLTRVGAPAVEVNLQPMRKHHPHPVHEDHPQADYNGHAFGRRRAEPVIPPDVPSIFTDPLEFDPPIARPLPQPAALPFPKPVLRAVTPCAAEIAPAQAASCEACPTIEEAAKIYHINLRLKRPRYVRLKMAAALTRRPVQDIVAEALDAWFAGMPGDIVGDCACLRGRGD